MSAYILPIALIGVAGYYLYNKNTNHHEYESYKSIADKLKYKSKIAIDKQINLNKVYGHLPCIDYNSNIIRKSRRFHNLNVY